ncbi:MAG: hypothetical protein ACYS22_16140, partial [Planctomycetota bacterium]
MGSGDTAPVPAGMRALEWIGHALVGLALFTPLLVAGTLFIYPFVAPKVFALRAIVSGLAAVYALLCLAQPGRFRPSASPITLAVGAFGLSLLLSTLFGVDRHRSLWDSQERMLGFVTILGYGLFYLAASGIVRTAAAWRRLVIVLLFVGVIVAGIGVAQKFDPDLVYNAGQPRVSSTLGHPSYLGGLGLFMLFAGVWLALRRGEALPARLLASGVAVLGVTAAAVSETRGTFVGIAVGLFVLLAWYLVTGRSRRERLWLGSLLLTVVTACSI